MAKLKITSLQDKIEKFDIFYDNDFCNLIYPDQNPDDIRNLGRIILKWIQSNTKLYPINFCFYPNIVSLKQPDDTSKEDILKIEKSIPPEFKINITLYKNSSKKKSKKMDVEEESDDLLDDSNLE